MMMMMMMNNKLGMKLTEMIGIMINKHDEDHHYDHIHILFPGCTLADQ